MRLFSLVLNGNIDRLGELFYCSSSPVPKQKKKIKKKLPLVLPLFSIDILGIINFFRLLERILISFNCIIFLTNCLSNLRKTILKYRTETEHIIFSAGNEGRGKIMVSLYC